MSESQTEGKELAEVNEDELKALLNESKERQTKENEGDGVKADYIILAKQGTKALSKLNKDLYIEGLAQGDFFLQKDKVNLGSSIRVVPLAFITIYNEKSDETKDAKFFGIWNKEQACKFDLAEDSYFNRQLPNGHILIPVNWVMVEVLGHPEIERAVIVFKSTGSRIWKEWKEDAKGRSGTSATLVYQLSEKEYKNDKFSWTDFGFEYVENLVETDKSKAIFCLKKSNKIRDDYEKSILIGNHDLKALSAPKTVAYVEDVSDVEESEDEDDVF